MRADNSPHVIAAAQRRAEQTRQCAPAALRRMDVTGQQVTFDTVSREAAAMPWPDRSANTEPLRSSAGHPSATR
jgi:hypothetical protein